MNKRALKSSISLLVMVSIIVLLGSTLNRSQAETAQPLRSIARVAAEEAQSQTMEPRLEAADAERLFWHEAIGGPASLQGKSIDTQALGLSAEEGATGEQIAQAFLWSYGSELQMQQADITWNASRNEEDEQTGAHVFLEQQYRGLSVIGGEVVVHIRNGTVVGANGGYLAEINIGSEPLLSLEEAVKPANRKLGLAQPVLRSSELVIYNPALLNAGPGVNYLAYRLVIGEEGSLDSWVVMVEANSGKVLLSYNDLRKARNRNIHDLNGSEALPGPLSINEAGPIGSPSTDSLNAYNYTGNTYDYYLSTHGRDSFDNNGATLRASVRYGYYGDSAWTGAQTYFGPGYAVKDIVAHEWTHAVIVYTAGLINYSQSGTISESIADVFAAMVDRDDWTIGEDLAGGAIRSLADPTSRSQPGKVSDLQYFCDVSDNSGIHINSGVLNHAAYLISEGGSYNGRTVTGIGRNATELIFYRALTRYLVSGSNFNDAYSALISAASDLYGGGSGQVTNVTAALQAVEMNTTACASAGDPADAWEADNDYSQAKGITPNGTAQTHTFHQPGDNDWAKFDAVGGTNYVIETRNLGENSDTYLYLYDRDGATILAYDNDVHYLESASRVSWTAPSSGTYYIRVRHLLIQEYGASTSYDLAVFTPSLGGADGYEEDDSRFHARTITPNGAEQTHRFHSQDDHDWVQFTAAGGATYVIETFNLSPGNDTIMYLYQNGELIDLNDDWGGGGWRSLIQFAPAGTGTVYVCIRHSDEPITGANYSLKVTATGLPSGTPTRTATAPPGNTPGPGATATPATPDRPLSYKNYLPLNLRNYSGGW